METKLPFAYLMVNFPSLSEVVAFSCASAIKFSFSSINTSAPEIYPSTTTPSVCLNPSIVIDAFLEPPAPEQLRVNVVLPEMVIETSSVPDVALDPLH